VLVVGVPPAGQIKGVTVPALFFQQLVHRVVVVVEVTKVELVQTAVVGVDRVMKAGLSPAGLEHLTRALLVIVLVLEQVEVVVQEVRVVRLEF
jgi:hypothetical protein